MPIMKSTAITSTDLLIGGGIDDEKQKMEVDYSETCDKKVPEFKELALSEGKFLEAIEGLLALEKQTRTGGDMVSTSKVLIAIVEICYELKNWSALNEYVALLVKRRSQLKQAVVKMVQKCCTYVDEIRDKCVKLTLIDTLRNVTEGKIYVEVERARLTHKLADMKEADGDVEGAANIMQELQVETYGSMEKKEKVELILEQMRLVLAKKDYIRGQIISKKISVKFFDDVEDHVQDLKLKYYRLMIQLEEEEKSYLSICKYYRAILDTPKIKSCPLNSGIAMKNIVVYLILSPFNNEQSDLTHRILEEELLQQMPVYKELLNFFVSGELINWKSICDTYENELRKENEYVAGEANGSRDVDMEKNESSSSSAAAYASLVEIPPALKNEQQWNDLKKRIVEYNIRTMAKYYVRVTLEKMSQLLDLPIQELEDFLCAMVEDKSVSSKIDRPMGIVTFGAKKTTNGVLNEWSENLNKLMKLMHSTTHLINKEHMLKQKVSG